MAKNLNTVERGEKVRIGKLQPHTQADNTIIVNASETIIQAPHSGFFASPIREDLVSSTNVLAYNATTNEIVQTAVVASDKTLQQVTDTGNVTTQVVQFTNGFVSSGLVGIAGNTSPVHSLDIGSNIYIDDTSSSGNALYVRGNVYFDGNVTTFGETTFISSKNISITDPILELGQNNVNQNLIYDLGILMKRPGENVGIAYLEASDEVFVGYTENTASERFITSSSNLITMNVVGDVYANAYFGDGRTLTGVARKDDLESNTQRIGVLETDALSNNIRVSDLEIQMSSNGIRVGNLESNLAANSVRIGNLEYNLQNNSQRISTLYAYHASNVLRIEDLEANVNINVHTRLNNLESNLTDNSNRITTLSTRLEDNSFRISVNTANIANLQVTSSNNFANIATLQTYALSNSIRVSTLETSLQSNALILNDAVSNLAANSARISALEVLPAQLLDNSARISALEVNPEFEGIITGDGGNISNITLQYVSDLGNTTSNTLHLTGGVSLKTDGFVGINVEPQYELHVGGDLQVDGNFNSTYLTLNGDVNNIIGNTSIQGNTTIHGNLVVHGATSYLYSDNVKIQDPIIGIGNNGLADTGIIIAVQNPSNVVFGYDASETEFIVAHSTASVDGTSITPDAGTPIDFRVYGDMYSNTLTTVGDVVVGGNLEVRGNTTFLQVDNLAVDDAIIKIAAGNELTTLDSGVVMQRAEANVAMVYRGDENELMFAYTTDDPAGVDITPDTSKQMNVHVYGSFFADKSINVNSNTFISETGAVTANIYFGDGGLLSNITQTLQGITNIGNTTNQTLLLTNTNEAINAVANIVTQGYYFGNGEFLTGISNVYVTNDIIASNLETARTYITSNVNILNDNIDSNLETARTYITSNVNILNDNIDSNLSTARDYITSNVNILNDNIDSNLETARTYITSNVNILNDNIDSNLSTARDYITSNVNILNDNIDSNLETARTYMTSNVNILNDNIDSNLETARTYITSNLETARNYITSNVNILNDNIASNLETARNYITSNVNILNDNIDSNLSTARDYITSNVNILNDNIDSNLETARTYITSNVNILNDNIASNLSTARDYITSNVNILNDNITSNVDILNDNIDSNLETARTYITSNVQILNNYIALKSNILDPHFSSNISVESNVTTSTLAVTTLTAGRVPYVGTDSFLVDHDHLTFTQGAPSLLSVGGDVNVSGNLFVQGTTTFLNTTNTIINDAIVELANNNTSDTLDMGFIMTRPSSNVGVGFRGDEAEFMIGHTLSDPSDADLVPDTGNALAVHVYGSMDVDKDLEVGTTNLYVQTTTGRVGIRTNAPGYPLDVRGAANVSVLTAQGVAVNRLNLTGSNVVDIFGTANATAYYGNGGFLSNVTLQQVTTSGNTTTRVVSLLHPHTALTTDLTSNVDIKLDQLANVVLTATAIEDMLVYDGSNWTNQKQNHTFLQAKAEVALSKGDVVYATGTTGNDIFNVNKADARDPAKMPAIGVLYQDLAQNDQGLVVTFGRADGVALPNFIEGETVYVSNTTPGGLSNIVPHGETNGVPELIQNIGIIVKPHATNGIVSVTGVGRTNAIPNANVITQTPAYVYTDGSDERNTLHKIAPTNLLTKLQTLQQVTDTDATTTRQVNFTNTHTWSLTASGNIYAASNVTALEYYGDGTKLTGVALKSNFDSNVLRIGVLETDLASNASILTTLKTDHENNVVRIGVLETDVASNASILTTLKTDHENNVVRIGVLETDVASNASILTTLKTDHENNVVRIGVLETDLASNASILTTLKTDHENNVVRIGVLETDLASNATILTTLKTDHENNVARLDTAIDDITDLENTRATTLDPTFTSNITVNNVAYVNNGLSVNNTRFYAYSGSMTNPSSTIGLEFASNVFYARVMAQLVYDTEDVNTLVLELQGGKKTGTSSKNITIGTLNKFGDTTKPWSSDVTTSSTEVTIKPHDLNQNYDYEIMVEYTSPGTDSKLVAIKEGSTAVKNFPY